ncbi:MAG: Quinolinate synthetase, partial [uncultured Thermomicrobiales bacterium]
DPEPRRPPRRRRRRWGTRISGRTGLDGLVRRAAVGRRLLRAGSDRRRLRPAPPLRRLAAAPGAHPACLLQAAGRGARRPDLGAAPSAGRPPRRPRPPLPARRGDPVRRLPGRQLQALPARRRAERGRVHPLLRRPLHGRERRHPLGAGPASDPAEPGGRLLDGRHGEAGGCPGRLGRAGGARHRRSRPRHLHELRRQPEGVLRPQWRHRLHVVQRRQRLRLVVRPRRAALLLSGRAPRPQHRRQEGHPRGRDGRLGPVPAPRRQLPRGAPPCAGHPLEGLLLRPRPLHRRPDRQGAGRLPGRQRGRPPGVPAGGRPGGGLRRLDRVHYRHHHRCPGRDDLGRRHRGQPRQPPEQRAAGQARLLPGPRHLPVQHDVPGPPRLRALDAGAPRRGQGRQPDHCRPGDPPRRPGRPRADVERPRPRRRCGTSTGRRPRL